MGKIADLPFGWVGTYDDNEVEIVSTIKDPPKVRLAVDADKVESNLGAVSFNLRRSDGRHEEYGLVMGRLTADRSGGAIYLAVRPSPSQGVREVAYFDSNTIVLFGGKLVLVKQGDGNFVLYVDGKPVRATFGLPPEQLW